MSALPSGATATLCGRFVTFTTTYLDEKGETPRMLDHVERLRWPSL
jgi:hypothetical protein